MRKYIKKRKRAFTLVELIIVIAIIGILAAIAIPKFLVVREDSKEKADLANAKLIKDSVTIMIANEELDLGNNTELKFNVDKIDEEGKYLFNHYLHTEKLTPKKNSNSTCYSVKINVSTKNIYVYSDEKTKQDDDKNLLTSK